jgi:hypothetical protein
MAWPLGPNRAACVAAVAVAAAMFAAGAHAQEETAAPADSPAPAGAPAADSEASSETELAKKLSNPVASLISVPLQSNVDSGFGPLGEGQKFTLNVQPVIPFRLSENWTLISRTIVPIVSQENFLPGSGSQFGLSDTLQSLFLSPSAPGKLIWGVGPALLIPTGTDTLLGTGKWSAGPTAVVLTQANGWTVGALANQLWSFAGDASRSEYNKLYVQPFLNYTTKRATTYGLSAEGTYDWTGPGLSMPLVASIGQVTKVAGQLISLTVGLKYYVATVPNGPHGFGGRLVLTFLFPKR